MSAKKLVAFLSIWAFLLVSLVVVAQNQQPRVFDFKSQIPSSVVVLTAKATRDIKLTDAALRLSDNKFYLVDAKNTIVGYQIDQRGKTKVYSLKPLIQRVVSVNFEGGQWIEKPLMPCVINGVPCLMGKNSNPNVGNLIFKLISGVTTGCPGNEAKHCTINWGPCPSNPDNQCIISQTYECY